MGDGSYVIRHATSRDRDMIASFNVAMAKETENKKLDPDIVRSGVAALIDNPDRGFYLVATHNDSPVACLLVTFEWSDWRNAMFWWIQSVYVDHAHRRQGVFRRLHAEVARLAQQHGGICGLRLYVERENEAAKCTYRSRGMTETHYRIFEQEF